MKNYKVRMAHSFMSKMEHSDDLKLLWLEHDAMDWSHFRRDF
jgi:hypothetical protein